MNILFVCFGNICRSSTAECVFRSTIEKAGLANRITMDSAGTAGYHVGEPSDSRSIQVAAKRGYDMNSIRARQVVLEDYSRFDLLLAMDNSNLKTLQEQCPEKYQEKIKLFLDYGKTCEEREVPDPYYGGPSGFDHVLNLIEDASAGLLAELQSPA